MRFLLLHELALLVEFGAQLDVLVLEAERFILQTVALHLSFYAAQARALPVF